MRKVFLLSLLLVVLSLVIPWLVVTLGPAPEPAVLLIYLECVLQYLTFL